MNKYHRDIRITALKSVIKKLKSRLTLLDKYRKKDLDKEYLDTLNELNRRKKELKELDEDEQS